MKSLVSVIIPTYNREDSIVNTLQSVLNQSYRPLEVIIVDDGSNDDTEKVVAPYLIKSEDLSVAYYYQKNAGVSAARNLGIEKAHGEYILFLDSDDCLMPDKIEKQIKLMEKEWSEVCYSNILRKAGDTTDSTDVNAPDKDPVRQFLLFKNIVCIDAWMFRRKLIHSYNLRFRVGCSWGEDNEFLVKTLCLSGGKVSFVKDDLVIYTVGRADGLSKFSWDKIDKDIFIYNRILEWLMQQNIADAHKQIYKSIITRYTIPALIVGKLWGGWKQDKHYIAELLRKYDIYLSASKLLTNCFSINSMGMSLRGVKLFIKYVLLRFFIL